MMFYIVMHWVVAVVAVWFVLLSLKEWIEWGPLTDFRVINTGISWLIVLLIVLLNISMYPKGSLLHSLRDLL